MSLLGTVCDVGRSLGPIVHPAVAPLCSAARLAGDGVGSLFGIPGSKADLPGDLSNFVGDVGNAAYTLNQPRTDTYIPSTA